MIPSLKDRPSMTSVIFSLLRKRLHFFEADLASLNIMAKLARLCRCPWSCDDAQALAGRASYLSTPAPPVKKQDETGLFSCLFVR